VFESVFFKESLAKAVEQKQQANAVLTLIYAISTLIHAILTLIHAILTLIHAIHTPLQAYDKSASECTRAQQVRWLINVPYMVIFNRRIAFYGHDSSINALKRQSITLFLSLGRMKRMQELALRLRPVTGTLAKKQFFGKVVCFLQVFFFATCTQPSILLPLLLYMDT